MQRTRIRIHQNDPTLLQGIASELIHVYAGLLQVQCVALLAEVREHSLAMGIVYADVVTDYERVVVTYSECPDKLVELKRNLSYLVRSTLEVLEPGCRDLITKLEAFGHAAGSALAEFIKEQRALVESNRGNIYRLRAIQYTLSGAYVDQLKADCNTLLTQLQEYVVEHDGLLGRLVARERLALAADEINAMQLTAKRMCIGNELTKARREALAADCRNGLVRIRAQFVVPDALVSAFLEAQQAALDRSLSDTESLRAIKAAITAALEAITSPEVRAVNDIVRRLHGEAYCLTVGKNAKASRIAIALEYLPILARKTVITGPHNAVQEALASHRLWCRRGVVYKNERGEIDMAWSATTFKKMREQFTPLEDVVEGERFERFP